MNFLTCTVLIGFLLLGLTACVSNPTYEAPGTPGISETREAGPAAVVEDKRLSEANARIQALEAELGVARAPMKQLVDVPSEPPKQMTFEDIVDFGMFLGSLNCPKQTTETSEVPNE